MGSPAWQPADPPGPTPAPVDRRFGAATLGTPTDRRFRQPAWRRRATPWVGAPAGVT